MSDRVAKSLKISGTADDVINRLRIVPGTQRKKSWNSVAEDLIENSPEFIKELKNKKR